MILYVNGQDIERLVLGMVGEKTVEPFLVAPDVFLRTVRDFLVQRHASLDDVKTIVCVRGPGSATALRVSLSMVQALAFAKEIRLVPVDKDPKDSDESVFQAITEVWIAAQPVTEIVTPLYTHAPQITVAKRDQLKRSL